MRNNNSSTNITNSIYADANGNDINPWYREPWPYIIFGIPAFTVVACTIFLFIALSNPPELLAQQSAKNQNASITAKVAQDWQINANVQWNNLGQLIINLKSAKELTDKALSVAMIEIADKDKIKINQNNQNAPIATSKIAKNNSTIYLDLDPIDVNKKKYSFISNKNLSDEQTSKNYWLEIVGYKGAWTIYGVLSPDGFINN